MCHWYKVTHNRIVGNSATHTLFLLVINQIWMHIRQVAIQNLQIVVLLVSTRLSLLERIGPVRHGETFVSHLRVFVVILTKMTKGKRINHIRAKSRHVFIYLLLKLRANQVPRKSSSRALFRPVIKVSSQMLAFLRPFFDYDWIRVAMFITKTCFVWLRARGFVKVCQQNKIGILWNVGDDRVQMFHRLCFQ